MTRNLRSETLRPLLAAKRRMTRTSIERPRDAFRCKAVRSGAQADLDTTLHQPSRGERDSHAPVHRRMPALLCRVMEILTQRDYVDGEMPQRARARIAGSAIAARFGRFADCPEP